MADRAPEPRDNSGEPLTAREIARRNEKAAGSPLSPVMKTAATACELAQRPAAPERRSNDPEE